MLFQIHHQDRATLKTEFVAQKEFMEGVQTNDEFQEWIADITSRFPPQDGHGFFVCNEKDDHFVWAAEEPRP